jgi:hypothetical protein
MKRWPGRKTLQHLAQLKLRDPIDCAGIGSPEKRRAFSLSALRLDLVRIPGKNGHFHL